MDWLQFISSIVGSVAWPTAIVVAMLLFRGKLNELLPRMRFKHGETELSFRLEKAEQEAAALPSPTPDAVEAYVDEVSVEAFDRGVGKIYPEPVNIIGKGRRWLREELDKAIDDLVGLPEKLADLATEL